MEDGFSLDNLCFSHGHYIWSSFLVQGPGAAAQDFLAKIYRRCLKLWVGVYAACS